MFLCIPPKRLFFGALECLPVEEDIFSNELLTFPNLEAPNTQLLGGVYRGFACPPATEAPTKAFSFVE